MSPDDDRIDEVLARILEVEGAEGAAGIEAILAEHPDLEAPLRARLRVLRMLDALHASRSGARAASSVLASLSRTGRGVRPVSLPEPAGETPPPVVLPQAPSGHWGRYTVQGEIARGGVGVVLKARDPDLGRDVALKILREEHASRPDVLQRFVEEAQIGGQLQHPGVVPVYELGMGSDGQPYFVMKLVKGRTLAHLLAERTQPAADRPRFLAIFQAVCQTLAYAHERRIVHRDLKPSNVMVGAFGEVQVFDWGMAKVLACGGAADDARSTGAEPTSLVQTMRSASGSEQSVEGSVIGTPQYMAPEQARGEMERLDERADVFSLGAILCEILTGNPPYEGTDREVLMAATHARLGPAHDRLRVCGVDPELVALATRCLAADRADRPRDAGVLTHEITAHLASLEDRARKAEVAAGEARVLASEERKARRLTLSLSAAVVVLLVVGGGGWTWVDHQRRARAEAAELQVSEALAEATRLRARAETAAMEEALPLWREALATARRAKVLAASDDADQATRERVTSAMTSLENAQMRAELAAEQHRRNDAAVERLDEIRARAGETWNWKATSVAYAGALRDYLGDDVLALSLEEAARRIRGSAIHDRLLRALDDWGTARGRVGEDFKPVGDLIVRVDSDPWRAKVRKAVVDLKLLVALADQANLDALDVQDVLWLGDMLASSGDPDRGRALALEAWHRHPDDFWACFNCGSRNQFVASPRPQEAIGFYRAALALRPRSVSVRVNMGLLLLEQGEVDDAIREFRDALGIDPNFTRAHAGVGNALQRKGDLKGAIAAFREAVRINPNEGETHSNLGTALEAQGDSNGAIREYRKAVHLNPEFALPHYNLANRLNEDEGDLDGASAEYREAIRLDPQLAPAYVGLGAVLFRKEDFDGAIVELHKGLRIDPTDAAAHWTLAIAQRSRGALRPSLEGYRKAHELALQGRSLPLPQSIQLEEVARAERLLAASERLPAFVRGEAKPPTAQDAFDMASAGYYTASYLGSSLAWAQAFGMEPSLAEDMSAGHRYNAACSATLAGAGKGTDAATLDETGRTRWRKQALEWLRADLDAWKKVPDTKAVRATLEHWKADADLAGIRDDAELAKRPAEERDACRALWRDVDEALGKLATPK